MRLLIETLIAAAIIAPLGYVWYSVQVRRTAATLLDRAAALVKEGDDAKAAQYYFQYLKLRPDDPDAQILLAETFDRAAKDPAAKAQAVEYFYQAIGVAPPEKHRELHRRAAELLVELRRFVPAEDEARELLKSDKDDPQGWRLLALAVYGQASSGSPAQGKDPAQVGATVQKANQLNPGNVELAGMLAETYRHHPQWLDDEHQKLSEAELQKKADETVDAMVEASGNDARALLARSRYRTRYHLPGAESDLAASLGQSPDDLEIVLQAAHRAMRDAETAQSKGEAAAADDFAQARKLFERAIAIAPAIEAGYLGLGELHLRQGQSDRAAEAWRRGLEKANPQSIELNSRLADMLVVEGRLDEADKTLTTLERTAERIGPMLPSPAKLALRRSNDLLRAKWLVRKGRHFEAMPLLRRIASGGQADAAEAARNLQAWHWLGLACSAADQWDQAALAFEQAAQLAPKAAAPRLQAASAWLLAGRPDAAETCYQQALTIDASADTRLALAHAMLQRQTLAPVASRSWEGFDKALAEAKDAHAKKPISDAWRLKMLEIDYLAVRAQEGGESSAEATAKAVALCGEAEREYPDAVRLWQTLVGVYQRLGRPDDADRVVSKLETIEGQAATACLLRARLSADRGEFDRARATLTSGLDTLPEDVRPALQRELVQIAIREGRPEQVGEQLAELRRREPKNRQWLALSMEQAFEAGRIADVEPMEKELRELEGPDGLFWRYYQARRLLAEAQGPNDPKLAEASKLQSFIQNQRPAWSKVHLLQGLLSEATGQFEQAVEAYREAIRLGERLPMAKQRLISLLLQTNRVDEADQYLALADDQIAPSATFSSLEMAVATRRGQLDRALETARRGVEQRPDDAIARLWLGQMLLAVGQREEAETALQKAVELAPDDPRTLNGLFTFYIRTAQPDRARKTLQRISENAKLSESQRASILAQGYEWLGDQAQAAANYRKAAEADGSDAAAQLRLAQHLLRRGSDRAEPERILRDLLAKRPDTNPARWMLAELLVEQGGESQWQEARRLAEQAGNDPAQAQMGRRVQAMLLMRRGGKENLDAARRLLEELVAGGKNVDDADRLALARLYDAQGGFELAKQQCLILVDRENPSAGHLRWFVDLMLRNGRLDEADPWLKKLEAIAPDDLGATALRARWLRESNQTAGIEPLVEAAAEKLVRTVPENPSREADIAFAVGSLYITVDQPKAAERWFRRLAALMPERYEPLAGALAKQGRIGEAIELCAAAAKSDDSTRPALALVTVLLAGKPTEANLQAAAPLLEKAAADHPDDADLLSGLAALRVVEQRLDEAAELYRRILKQKPADVGALNNLATLLGEQPDKRAEAIACIDRALGIAGPQPRLLDTKGTILLFEKKAAEAVPLLEEAATAADADPRYRFHLAAAYDAAGETEKARNALRAAREKHLNRQVLTPLDQKMLADLEKKYE